MKILMMSSGTPNSRLNHRYVALGRELVKRGHEVTMMAPSRDKHSNWQPDRPEVLDGIRMVYPWQLGTKSVPVNLLPYMVSAAVKVWRQRADLIYISKPSPASMAGLVGKWAHRTPVVLDMDDLGSEVMRSEGQPAVMWRLVQACERLAARQASALVGVSRWLERMFAAHYRGKPVLRLPNGVDVAEFPQLRPEAGRAPRLIFFGMLGRPGILAPVMEALPEVVAAVGAENVRLEVLGDGPARGELEVLAGRLGVASNVNFRGWTTFEQLGEHAAAGDIAICIMPESLGTAACSNQKVFQYMALGLAMVVSDVGDLPMYAESGQAGVVVTAGDRHATAAALVQLLRDPQLRTSLAARGVELAHTKYAWSNLAGQLDALLQEVVK